MEIEVNQISRILYRPCLLPVIISIPSVFPLRLVYRFHSTVGCGWYQNQYFHLFSRFSEKNQSRYILCRLYIFFFFHLNFDQSSRGITISIYLCIDDVLTVRFPYRECTIARSFSFPVSYDCANRDLSTIKKAPVSTVDRPPPRRGFSLPRATPSFSRVATEKKSANVIILSTCARIFHFRE